MTFFVRKYSIGFVFLGLLFACQTIPTSEYSGTSEDLNLIKSIKNNANKFSSERSILWVEKGYLSDEEINLLQERIDKGIADIENFIGVNFDKEVYKKDKIEYFVHSKKEASHTITRYQPRKYMSPVVFLTYADVFRTPYLHETVHIIAWDWNTLWMKEGLAVFLNDKLGGYPAFPNYGVDIDNLAKSNIHFRNAMNLVGQNGVPRFSDRKERRVFYIFSGSFVKYLHTNLGIKNLMEIYKPKNTKKAVAQITGKNLDKWKKEWVDSLK